MGEVQSARATYLRGGTCELQPCPAVKLGSRESGDSFFLSRSSWCSQPVMARFLHPEQLHVIGRRFLNYSSGQTTAMRSCVRTSVSSKLGSQQLRWASHKPETLTKKALLEQVQAGLGKDVDGKPLRLNPKSKTVSTAAGHLPISPVFDPAWMQTRRRQTKADPQRPEGRFRRKLIMNPYGLQYWTIYTRMVALTNEGSARFGHAYTTLRHHGNVSASILPARSRGC